MSNSETPDKEYRVLARKYRPSNFDDLIGQEPMVRTLSNAFATNRIAQAYMLTGVRGVGKTTTARILARALNYEAEGVTQPTLDLSEPGVHCPDIMEGNHVDVIEMDAASHTGIGDIREIIASVRYKPVSARYKVYIIDEVHMLSNAAFNGLLKTLEEPPAHVKFIFATTEIRKVPITVLSRCQRFDLRRIEAGEMTAHLQNIAGLENIETEPEALAMIARASEGSVRDALSLLDQAIAHAAGAGDGKLLGQGVREMLGLADRARVIDLFEHIMKGDIAAALNELKAQYDVGADPATVLTDLAEFTHFVTRIVYVDSALDDPSLSEDEKTRGKDFADRLSPRILGRTWQMLLKGIAEVQASSRPLAAADMVLVRLTHAADLPSPEDALKALGDADGPVMSGSAAGSVAPSGGGGASAVASGSMPGGGGGGATMRRSANGPTLVVDHEPEMRAASEETVKPVHLKAVPDPEPEAELEAEPENAPVVVDTPAQPDFEIITSLSDLLAVCEKTRTLELKLMLRNHFSEFSFSEGHIEFAIVGTPRLNLVHELRSKLLEWTGKPWNLITREETGSGTLKDREIAKREQEFADAEMDPVVAAVLKMFPKSKIRDVRFPNADSEDGLDETAVMEAALDNPDEDEANETDNSGDLTDPGAGSLDDYFK